MRHERSNENSEGVLDRYLADWAAVVEFRRDGGVGYPIGVSEGGGSGARFGSGLPLCGERYLEIERMLDGETVVRAMAERMYVGSVGTVHEYVAERLGRNRGMARALEAVYGGIWRFWRVRVIESLGLGVGDDYRSWADLKLTVDSRGREKLGVVRRSAVATAQVPPPAGSQMTEGDRAWLEGRTQKGLFCKKLQ